MRDELGEQHLFRILAEIRSCWQGRAAHDGGGAKAFRDATGPYKGASQGWRSELGRMTFFWSSEIENSTPRAFISCVHLQLDGAEDAWCVSGQICTRLRQIRTRFLQIHPEFRNIDARPLNFY